MNEITLLTDQVIDEASPGLFNEVHRGYGDILNIWKSGSFGEGGGVFI